MPSTCSTPELHLSVPRFFHFSWLQPVSPVFIVAEGVLMTWCSSKVSGFGAQSSGLVWLEVTGSSLWEPCSPGTAGCPLTSVSLPTTPFSGGLSTHDGRNGPQKLRATLRFTQPGWGRAEQPGLEHRRSGLRERGKQFLKQTHSVVSRLGGRGAGQGGSAYRLREDSAASTVCFLVLGFEKTNLLP